LGLVVLLSGCDFFYGVHREAQLQTMPQLDCVGRVIKATPGVKHLQTMDAVTGQELTLSGLPQEGPVYTFTYTGTAPDKLWGTVQLQADSHGIRFTNDDMWINEKPPQTQVDATRPVMRTIEQGLAAKCGLSDLPVRVREYCTGVVCKPL